MGKLNRDIVVQILGPMDAERVARIIATGASEEELLEARAWLEKDEHLGRDMHRSLSGRVAAVYEILWSDPEKLEEPDRD